MENAMYKTEEVELNLPGIDKTWVRSNGEWRDKSTMNVEPTEMTIHDVEEESRPSRGWKFWKKR